MKKLLFFSLLSLSAAVFCLAGAENVVRLEPTAGTANEYSVAELLRVELTGDYIRFIGTDGTQVAEVYKYDYVKLTIADQPTAVEPVTGNPSPVTAQKIILDGQVYILFGDKAYRIDGSSVK